MAAELLPVWNEIEKYIEWGISIIPVRDKEDSGGIAKSPFGNWKMYQHTIIARDVLFDLMDVRYNTTAVAMIGGKVSGNLEIIDVDVKYKQGIDAILFQAIQTLYPDLFKKLRIHKTPSSGYHIPYRCEEPVPGNQKLAGRDKTPEELASEPRPKTVNFIETRGEGGFALAPPSLNYTVVKDCPIPMLTANERESLISLCRSYNEIIKIERPPAPTKQDIEYYETNPFEDYNNRVDPSQLCEELGWKFFKGNNHFLWYTRPGKTKGVSMSFNLQKRFFYCFTASTELEENKGYSPANLLASLQFLGDKKKLYQYLVANGYGKIKPKVEQRLAKKAAINGKPLPTNASKEAQAVRQELSATIDANHPYGTFWIDSVDGVKIDREKLLRVASGLGFMLYNTELIQSDGIIIEKASDRYFFDTLKFYIKEEDADLYGDICNAYELFIERHGKFFITRLPILNDDLILKDTKEASYQVYENGILKITAQEISFTTTNLLIWRDSIHKRKFKLYEGGRYVDFLKLATNYDDYLLSCIGYLAHEYKDETAAYIIVLTEEVENPKDGGGAGKNVFCELFKHITSFTGQPGSQVKLNEDFLQSWNDQKIMCISDVPKNFNFSFLKSLTDGGGLMKKLFKDLAEIPSDLMPKFLIQTNYSYEITDGGLKRRIKGIEFTDFFTKTKGIDVHFGVHFPKGWEENDWWGFDTLMAHSIQKWLQAGRKIGEAPLSKSGWTKQFQQTYGQVIHNFIKENLTDWIDKKEIKNSEFKTMLERYYSENEIPKMYQPSMIKINEAIKDYCQQTGVKFQKDIEKTINSCKDRYKIFGEMQEDLPF